MAGTPVIRSGPVASIIPEEFDAAPTPADDSLTLDGDMKNGLGAATFIIFSTGFTSNADQLVAAGSQICGNSMSVVMSDDAVKGPFHVSVISNCVGPVGVALSAVSLYFEDGTNGGYHYFFSDQEYQGGWVQLIGDPSKTPDAGSALSLTATCTHVGMYIDSITGGESMFELVATAISWCGREIKVDGGTSTPGNEIDFNSISLRDRLTTRSTTTPITGQFYGHVESREGIISLKGPVQLGDDGSTNNTYMLETNTFCLWADLPVNTKFYRIDILSNGASNSTIVIWGDSATPAPVTIDVAGSTLRWALDTATVEPDEFSAYGCTLKRGRAWDLGSTTTIDGGVMQDITDVAMHAAALMKNAQIIATRLDYGLPPTTGKLIGSVFRSPVDFCLTISTQTANMTVDYEFDVSCRGAGKAIEFIHASGDILITAAAGYYQLVAADVTVSGSGTVSFPAGTPVDALIHVADNNGADLQNAQVIFEAGDGTGDLPFEDTVTITRSGSTASVSHTAHGFANSDKTVIRNVAEHEYNGVIVISNATTDAYDYTVSGTPATPATIVDGKAAITSTGVIVEGMTDVNGDVINSNIYSVDQVGRGYVRKSTSSPRFKTFNLAGNTVDSADGLIVNVRMIINE